MILTRLQIEDFRCLQSIDLGFERDVALISGPNGAGKTSLLEACHFAGRGRSFRQPRAERLVRHGQSQFRLVAEFQLGAVTRRVGIEYGRGHQRIRIDGADASSLADIAGELVIQVIEPEIHRLVAEGPEGRRRFVDYGVFHVEPAYLAAWRRFRRTLKQRNALLRQGAPPGALGVWDEALVTSAETIDSFRSGYVRMLRPQVQRIADDLGLPTIELAYRPGWDDSKTMLDALNDSMKTDMAMRQTTVGPHRADLKVSWDGRLAKTVVSRGQQKLLASAMILAQTELLARLKQDRSLLLVDDPGAELDGRALAALMDRLEDMPGQRILTSLQSEIPGLRSAPQAFHVERGQIHSLASGSA